MKDFEFPTEVEHIMVYDRIVSRKVIVKGSKVNISQLLTSIVSRKTVTTFGKIMSDNVMDNLISLVEDCSDQALDEIEDVLTRAIISKVMLANLSTA